MTRLVTYDEFIGEVQERAGLPSREAAIRATRATLRTLAERLTEGEATDLAVQLPPELRSYLDDEPLTYGEPFNFDEFLRRVADRTATEPLQAAGLAMTVTHLMCEVVPEFALDDVQAQLPQEYAGLFTG